MAITFKKLSGDTEVIPNPTLDGTETALSGLQIDGVKYAMGGGGTLQWVYKEEILADQYASYSTANNYKGKVLYLEGDYINQIISCIDTWTNDLVLWANDRHDKTISEASVQLTMNTDGTITFKKLNTTPARFKIYELVVA